MSMYYIKYFIFIVLLQFIVGCAQEIQPDDSDSSQVGATKTIKDGVISTSKSELEEYKKAITYIYNNDLDKAQPILMEFTEQRPELAGPWANLGLIKIKQNDYISAEKYIVTALKKNPEMPQALNMMGIIQQKNGKINEAEQLYKKSISVKPDYSNAHYNLALLYDIYLQMIPEAITHYKAYLKLINNEDANTRDWVEQLENSQQQG